MIVQQAVALMLISLAVAVLPRVGRALRVPSAVVEILFGVILGESLLKIRFSGEWLPFLAQLGFLLLMFQAGLEIDFTLLRKQGRKQVLFQVGVFAGSLTISFLSARLLGQHLFFTLILSTTSLGLVVPSLKGAGLSKSNLGQSILIAAMLADFLTLLGVTFFILWHQQGFGWQFISPLPLFAGFAVLLWAARLWAWWHPEKAEKLLLTENTEEQGVRLSMALLFLFVGVSELVHLEPVLGAFMGGCVLSFALRAKEHLESKISALGYGFLVPLFFIHVGIGFDIRNILAPAQLKFTAMLLGLAFTVKLVPMLFIPGSPLSLRERLQAGVLLSARLSLIVAAASIGLKEGFLTPQMKDAIVLLALSTCILSPLLFKLLTPVSGRPE